MLLPGKQIVPKADAKKPAEAGSSGTKKNKTSSRQHKLDEALRHSHLYARLSLSYSGLRVRESA